jgi:hypothetical protein
MNWELSDEDEDQEVVLGVAVAASDGWSLSESASDGEDTPVPVPVKRPRGRPPRAPAESEEELVAQHVVAVVQKSVWDQLARPIGNQFYQSVALVLNSERKGKLRKHQEKAGMMRQSQMSQIGSFCNGGIKVVIVFRFAATCSLARDRRCSPHHHKYATLLLRSEICVACRRPLASHNTPNLRRKLF